MNLLLLFKIYLDKFHFIKYQGIENKKISLWYKSFRIIKLSLCHIISKFRYLIHLQFYIRCTYIFQKNRILFHYYSMFNICFIPHYFLDFLVDLLKNILHIFKLFLVHRYQNNENRINSFLNDLELFDITLVKYFIIIIN